MAGAYLQIGPLIGLAVTVQGVIGSFIDLGATGVSDPHVLAQRIGESLRYTAVGLSLGFIGLVLIGIALCTTSYRAPWLFRLLVLYGILWLFNFPVATMFGFGLLTYCYTHRAEFRTHGVAAKTPLNEP